MSLTESKGGSVKAIGSINGKKHGRNSQHSNNNNNNNNSSSSNDDEKDDDYNGDFQHKELNTSVKRQRRANAGNGVSVVDISTMATVKIAPAEDGSHSDSTNEDELEVNHHNFNNNSSQQSSSSSAGMKHIIRPEVLSTFIIALFDMMNSPKWKESIVWNKEGDAIVVKDQPSFIEKVLKHYFKHSNMSSFIRQLNMYGFHKVGEPHEIIFKHPSFIRGQPDQLKNIHRRAPKDNRTKYQPSTVSVVDGVNAASAIEQISKVGTIGIHPGTPSVATTDIMQSDIISSASSSFIMTEIKMLRKSQEDQSIKLAELQTRNNKLENHLKKMFQFLKERYSNDAMFLSLIDQDLLNDKDKSIYMQETTSNILASPEPLGSASGNSHVHHVAGEKPMTPSSSPDLSNDLTRQHSLTLPANKSTSIAESVHEGLHFNHKSDMQQTRSKHENDADNTFMRLESVNSIVNDPNGRSEYFSFPNSLLDHHDEQDNNLSKISSFT